MTVDELVLAQWYAEYDRLLAAARKRIC